VGARQFLRAKFVHPIVDLLTQGVAPRQLALSLALGAVVGTFPLIGTTTTLCLLLAIALRLNLPVIQLSNYLVYPLQVLALLPLVRLGERLTRAPHQSLALAQVMALIQSSHWHALRLLWTSAAHALLAWALLALPAFLLWFGLFRLLVALTAQSLARRKKSGRI